jgi:hypothetical protein
MRRYTAVYVRGISEFFVLLVILRRCQYLDSFIHSFIHQWLYSPLLSPCLFFSCVDNWIPVARSLLTRRTTKTQNKRTQTSMPLVGFEPIMPAFERVKTVNALERAATVIGLQILQDRMMK